MGILDADFSSMSHRWSSYLNLTHHPNKNCACTSYLFQCASCPNQLIMVESKTYGVPDYVFLLTLSDALVSHILYLCCPSG